MPSHSARVAVCILRVEVESWGLLITMTTDQDLASGTAERVTRFVDTGEASAAVAAFLESFESTGQPQVLCIYRSSSPSVLVTTG
jgi:hypothetical protein